MCIRDSKELGRQTGEMALQILEEGKLPSELPVQFPETLQLVINEEMAEALGIDPDSIKLPEQVILKKTRLPHQLGGSFFLCCPRFQSSAPVNGGLAGVQLIFRVAFSDERSFAGGEPESYRRTPVRDGQPELRSSESYHTINLSPPMPNTVTRFCKETAKGVDKRRYIAQNENTIIKLSEKLEGYKKGKGGDRHGRCKRIGQRNHGDYPFFQRLIIIAGLGHWNISRLSPAWH
eukprot:TRINITY_DN10165_c0_g1_i1.p2 TRINITY_DN10165_c0_g1~~TRINITY_DN10165_c0_g1_i1.p2  ORF type:complete len:234 (-),score=12.52 TRINITY_DN10165_c0_g1_i1:205-906(-)